ncbi:hypothetical protein VC83_04074 [Pseudogymnoascus destructans]|uniref:Uncharacterized protein n=1 Tax=Pseudogymnoascus destructans TaxID=655981 RepID=A0A177ABP9_9PEZI|nr:uncharacterized protein VC83_04074 [Pseudogymnoascus destructans]OAF59535.1 hypothetical protein VC83_04074 [Pseudogymnoascus destructans]
MGSEVITFISIERPPARPKEYLPTPSWSKEITLPYHSRETSIKHPAYQSDANRRDFAIHREDRRRAGGRSMEMKVITSDYEEITDTPSNPPRNQEVSPPPQKTLVHRFAPMHICEISANAFHHEMMRNDSEFFQTSIYEIDQIIHEKELVEDEETLRLIQQKLPHMHRRYTDVFSKLESDRIPPHVTTEQEGWPTTGQEGGRSHETGPDIEDIIRSLPEQVIKDIKEVQCNVRTFAQAQKESLKEFELEIHPG